jgi:hypothetical protein
MTPEALHIVQTFSRNGKRLVPDQPPKCSGPERAKMRADTSAVGKAGAVAFSMTGDPEFGEYGEPVVLAGLGEAER